MHNLKQTIARVAESGPVQPIVLTSWERSRSAGVARDALPTFRRVSPQELSARQSENRLLLDLAVPHLRWLSAWFNERPHVAYVVDADGIVLHAEGDAAAIEQYRLAPGYDWSESQMGTNGAGTALASRAPVAVVGCDHWSFAWSDATCLAAPVLGIDGAPVGAIDISMDVREGDADRLVVAAHVAYTISQELARAEAEARARTAEEHSSRARADLINERQGRVEIETALARAIRAEQALQAIIDAAPAVIYVVDAETRFRLVNRRFCERFGVEADRLLGRLLTDCFPPDVAQQFAANNCRVLETGLPCEFEETVPAADGHHTFVSVKAPLYGPDGRAYAICGVSTDITERQRIFAALQVSQRQKDAMIATVAHELRQPLGAIHAALALMQARPGRDAGGRARGVVERQVRQLARLVEDLWDAARVVQGQLTIRPARIALNDVIDAALNVVQPSLREKDLHLEVELPPEAVSLDADAGRLQQVLSNLLTNAAKFTEPGGGISLVVRPDGDRVEIRLRDTGRGISPEHLAHVFDLFSQAAPDGTGLGIGLALVRGIVECHGGTVVVHSDGIGRGTEFLIRLPRTARIG